MPDLYSRIRYPKTVAAAAAGFVVYLLLGYLLAPRLIGQALSEYADNTLQRKASVGTVRVNPLLFRLELGDFALTERDGAPIVGFRRLLVDFELSSLARWAWTFSEITLEGLDLKADIAPGGRFNLAALLDSLPKGQPGGSPPRLLLQQVVLRDGTISFNDRSDPTPASTSVGPINLELKDISTLAGERGAYTVSARLKEGGALSWRGEISLEPISSQGEIEVKGVKPLTAWRFLQDELSISAPRGEMDFSARYRVAYASGAPQATVESLRVDGRDLELTASGAKQPILKLSSFGVAGGRFDLATRELVIAGIELRDGAIVAEVDAGGKLNWQKLVRMGASKSVERDGGTAGKPWKARVEALRVAGLGLDYTDRSRARPIRLTVKDVTAGLAALVETRPGGVQAVVQGAALTLGRVAGEEVAVGEPLIVLDKVTVEDGNLNLEENRLGIARVAVAGAGVRVTREPGGAIAIVDLMFGKDVGLLRREVRDALKDAKAEGQPWRVNVDALEIDGGRITLTELGLGSPVVYEVRDLRARVNGYSSAAAAPIKFETGMRIAQGGTVRAAGGFSGDGKQASAGVKVERISLKPLQPVVAQYSSLRLESGEVSADVKVEYRGGKDRPDVRAAGTASLDRLLLNEVESGDRLLTWKSLAANGLSFSLAPDRLRIEEVKLVDPGAKIVIFKDRSLNLVKVLEPKAGTQPPAAPDAAALPFEIAVERIVVENGTVNFADLSLVLPFATLVDDLKGTVSGVSSDPAGTAALKLEGRVGEYGLARVDGTLNPFHPKARTDIGVDFRNVEMLPLSPYSATFAGRQIASGRLSLDLRYKVENGRLAGDNKVVLDRFTLGEAVESPGALKLPFDLAIALLTDSDGQINIAVPVSGNVDDPQFSYSHLIWQAIGTVIRNIVTAPFRALAGLFGGGGANLESIAFDPGRSTLQPPEREKMKRVGEAMAKRPQLVLVAEGQHGTADSAALRERDVALAIGARLGRKPVADGLPEPVNPLDAKTQRALEALFVERSSEAALTKFVAESEKARGKPVDRVNPVLAMAGRASPDADFYRALLKHLNDTARLPDTALRELAEARARAVTDYMLQTLSVPAGKVAARSTAEPGEARVKFSFDVAGAPAATSAPRDPESPTSPR